MIGKYSSTQTLYLCENSPTGGTFIAPAITLTNKSFESYQLFFYQSQFQLFI